MQQKIKIAIAEDQSILRHAFVTFLNSMTDIEVVIETANGKQLLEHLNVVEPDIILLDLNMPVMDGWEALDVIHKRNRSAKVVILSNDKSLETIQKVSLKGAIGFISKDDDADNLAYAIRDVYCIGKYFSQSVSEALENYSKENSSEQISADELSERENQIVKEVCNGLSNNLISEKLFISPSTVDFHKQKIYKKTNCKNVLDLFKYALRKNIVSLQQTTH